MRRQQWANDSSVSGTLTTKSEFRVQMKIWIDQTGAQAMYQVKFSNFVSKLVIYVSFQLHNYVTHVHVASVYSCICTETHELHHSPLIFTTLTYRKRTKGKTRKQIATLEVANAAHRAKHTEQLTSGALLKARQKIKSLNLTCAYYKTKSELSDSRYWKERRRTLYMKKQGSKLKSKLADLKVLMKQFQSDLGWKKGELQGLRETSEHSIQSLQQRLDVIQKSKSELQTEHRKLKKIHQRLLKAKQALEKDEKQRKRKDLQMGKRQQVFQLKHKGVYTTGARKLARYLVSIGTTETMVGAAIQEMGNVLGVDVKDCMSERTVQRAVLEGGVASEIQLANSLLYSIFYSL
ncbi:hypothetical protein BDQ17DRAFT_1329686 [Cyathus striatus]|nr:hypothetical protein BDQ17DRAFT_1329686 [Cyathus striatus]